MMAVIGASSAPALADGQIAIIHTGDFHGHLTAHPNLRSNADYPGRGPQVVGRWVTDGLTFTDCAVEAPKFAEELRTKEGLEVVILLSEIEIGRNIQLIKSGITKPEQHIDLILNADMHEEVLQLTCL